MKVRVDLKKHLPKLTHCAARFTELLFAKLPGALESAAIDIGYSSKSDDRSELDLFCISPSKQLAVEVETKKEGVEIKFSEPGKRGSTSVLFFMHQQNFHRTCEAAVNFIAKVADGDIIIAREKKRTIPIIGVKKLRFFEVGEIIGMKADEIERIVAWKELNI